MLSATVVQCLKNDGDGFSSAFAYVQTVLGVIKIPGNECLHFDLVGMSVCLPPVGDELADDSVVFPSAGIGAVFTEIICTSSEADVCLTGAFVEAVFWKLFSFVCH